MKLNSENYDDYREWMAMRARGRFEHLSSLATRYGLPTGAGLSALAALGAFAGGTASLASVALQAWYLTSMSIAASVLSGWLEWRHLEHAFETRRER